MLYLFFLSIDVLCVCDGVDFYLFLRAWKLYG